MAKTITKWVVSILIGGLFVWLSAQGGRFDQLLGQPVHLVGTYLVSGDFDPARAQPAVEGAVLQSAESSGWHFNLLYILPYMGFLTAIHFLRVVRWSPLLRPLAHVRFRTLNRIGAVGFMAVFLFPLRLGEFVRPYMLAREVPRLRMSEALATIVVERVTDGLMVSLLLFFVLFMVPTSAESFAQIRVGAYVALAVFLGGMAVLAFLYWMRGHAIDIIDRLVSRISRGLALKVTDLLRAFLKGLAVLPDWRNFAWFCAYTAIYWGINGIGLWVFARGFSLSVSMAGAYAMMSCVVVGMMIPNSPGNVGTFWYFLLLPLELYGIGPTVGQATMFGLAVYLMQLLQQSLFGAWYLLSGKVSPHDVLEGTHADDVVEDMEVQEGIHPSQKRG